MSQTAEQTEYSFDISFVSRDVATGRAFYTISTNIPGCTAANVTWKVYYRGGFLSGGQYVVDESGMTNGESYYMVATYVYDSWTYTASCTVTCTWGSDNADGYSLSEAREDGWRDESAASGFSAAIPDRTSAAAPAEADRHSRNYAAR